MPLRSPTSEQGSRCLVCAGECRFLFSKFEYEIARCVSCGLGTATPMPTPAELAQLYANAYYDSPHDLGYHTEYGELEGGLKKMYRRFLRRVERRHPGQGFDRILDVGCAYGFFLDVVEEQWHPKEVVGVDVAPEARERNVAKGRTFHLGFFEEVDLPDGHFDLIFMGDAFEHMRDPLAVADKIRRILAPGGVLVATTVDFGSWLARVLGAKWRLMTPPEHLFFWTRRSFERVFTDRGFSAELGRYWLFYPKSYIYQMTRAQFGFAPRIFDLIPVDPVPIPSFDVLIGIFSKQEQPEA